MSFFERLKAEASAEWAAYTEHRFTNGMADGSLPEAAFCHYLVQDYLFLIEFARAYALFVYKSPKLSDMREAAAGLSAILDVEMNLHVKLLCRLGFVTGRPRASPSSGRVAGLYGVCARRGNARRFAGAHGFLQPRGAPPRCAYGMGTCRCETRGNGSSHSFGARDERHESAAILVPRMGKM